MEIKDIENIFMASPVARTNWASHVIMLNYNFAGRYDVDI